MVGANYMGGKRNTARAKSRDVVGRAQRRHFGKQRLVSALGVTHAQSRVPTLSSVLPEITLAHARCQDSDITSREVFRGGRLYSSTLPNNVTRRSKPSKVLGVLDTSDHMSMRAAIVRILQQPNLVGINTPEHKESAYTEQTLMAVTPPADDVDSKEIKSKHVLGLHVSHAQTPRDELAGLLKSNLDTRCEPSESGILSPFDSPSEMPSRIPFDNTGRTEAQLSTGVIPLFRRQGSKFRDSLDGIYPLPRSSPFRSSSPSSDCSILDLDTSPCAAIRPGRSGDPFEVDVEYVSTPPSRFVHRPRFRQPSRSFSVREGLAGTDTNSNGEAETERCRTIGLNDGRALPPVENDGFHSPRSGSAHGSVPVLKSGESIEDDAPNDLPIDFLSDPCPWETIGRILKLNVPESPTVHSVDVNFTKCVGYVSPEGSCTGYPPSFDATFEVQINDKLISEVYVAPSVDVADSMTIGTHSSYAWPLLDAATFPVGTNSCIDVLSRREALSIPVVQCTQSEPSLTPSAVAIGARAREPDINATFDGPCLFGDSDLEEDE